MSVKVRRPTGNRSPTDCQRISFGAGRGVAVVIVVALVIINLGGCRRGNSESLAQSPPRGGSLSLEDVSTGEISNTRTKQLPPAGAIGAQDRPIPLPMRIPDAPMISRYPLTLTTSNLCSDVEIAEHGTLFSRSGVEGRYLDADFLEKDETEPVMATLVCSTSSEQIQPLNVGPKPDGVSVPCPVWSSGLRMGSVSVYFESVANSTPVSEITSLNWAYGSIPTDGAWNMRFINGNPVEAVLPSMWAICG